MQIKWLAAALVVLAPGSAIARDDSLARMLSGQSAIHGKKLEKAIVAAERSPLGSADNPVRVTMPEGERAYLKSLRCSDGAAPAFQRQGSAGSGPFGNIMDIYQLTCAGGAPTTAEVFMDMYHGGFAEPRPVAGFTVAPR